MPENIWSLGGADLASRADVLELMATTQILRQLDWFGKHNLL